MYVSSIEEVFLRSMSLMHGDTAPVETFNKTYHTPLFLHLDQVFFASKLYLPIGRSMKFWATLLLPKTSDIQIKVLLFQIGDPYSKISDFIWKWLNPQMVKKTL